MFLLAAALLLAQNPGSLGGEAAGWTGAGLLGGVLAWLMFCHLPAKDKQIGELFRSQAEQDAVVLAHFDAVIEKKDKQIDQQRAEFTLTLNTMTVAFRSEMTAERVGSESHFKTLADTMNAALAQLGRQLAEHSLRNQQWLETIKKEIDVQRATLAMKEGR